MASKDIDNGGGDLGGPGKAGQAPPKRPRWQRLLGIRRRQGRYLRWTLTKWGFFLVILLVGGAVMAGFMEYTMQPEFCQSCHIMEPYFQAWHQSTHKGVSCLKCHFEPGLEGTLKGKWQASSQAIKYLTNTYGSKPHAEIHDSSCLREECHAKRLLEGKVNWAVPSSRGQGEKVTIRFDHTPHLKEQRLGMNLRCVSCHSQIVQGQHIVVTLDTCFLCHFKNRQHGRNENTIGTCKGCHDAPKDKIRLATGMFDHGEYLKRGVGCENCHSDSIKGDGAVPKQVCWVCHNKPAQTSRYAETQFLHTAHITAHKVECSSCHIQIEHNLTAGGGFNAQLPSGRHGELMNSPCGQCHEQTHLGPDSLYRGIGGRGVPDMPSPMFRTQVDCIGCHKAKERTAEAAEVVGQTFLTAQSSCDYCHGDKYQGRLDEWKKTIATHLAAAEAAQAKASAAVSAAKLSDLETLKARRLIDDAAHNIRLVKLGYGMHNVNYATALLNYAQQCCKQAEGVAATGAGAAPEASSATTQVSSGGDCGLRIASYGTAGREPRRQRYGGNRVTATGEMPAKPRQGRKNLAGGVSPRCAASNEPKPRRGDRGSWSRLLSPLRGSRFVGRDSGGLRPRPSAVGPSGLKTRSAPFALCLGLIFIAGGCGKSEPPGPPPSDSNTAGASMAHFEQAGQSKGAAVVPIKAVAPAPKPTGRLPAGASCVTPACHTSMAAARHIHGPVSKNACDTCHADDIGGHKYPLLRDKTKMCTFCHAVSGTAPHQHKALEQGCTVCHDPHVSSVKYLIKGDSIDQVCASCHRVPWKRFTHTILTVGQCTVCHQPHQSDNAMLLLGGQGPGNCYLCHDGLRQQMASLPHVHKPAASQCVTCHSPHASDFANQLKAPIRQTCLSNACHDHDKLAKHLDSVSRPHEAVVTGHIKQMALTPTTTALTNFRNGEVNLHYVHVNREPKGRTCRTCHAVHGSDLPKHMASEVPFEGSNWSMPIKFDKTATGESCSPGCHEPLGYDRDHPRPRPATRPAGPTTTKGAR